MSKSLNEVTLLGNVGNPPEIKIVSGNKKYATISIATSRSFKSATGELQEKTEWHRVKAWNQLAELIEKYVHKGDRIFVRAHLEYSSSGEGDQKKYYTDIVADNVIFLGSRQSSDDTSRPSTSPQKSQPSQPQDVVTEEDDDLPF